MNVNRGEEEEERANKIAISMTRYCGCLPRSYHAFDKYGTYEE